MTRDPDAHPPTDDSGDAGEIALGAEIEALLGDPTLWEEPSDDLGERVVAAVRSESAVGAPAVERWAPTWIRPALLGAAAVVVFLFGGIVLFSAISGSEGADEFSAELIPTGLVDDVDGSIELTSFDSGLRIELDAPSLPRREGDQFYEAWLRTEDGLLIPVGTFHDGERVTLWAGVDRDRVVAFSITRERAVPADSVDQRTSGDVVLKADLPAP